MENEEKERVEEIGDEDTIPLVHWLFDIWESVNNIDTAILGRKKKSQVEEWKEKIWDSLNHYINQLQDVDVEED